jgi:hypothetical protein
MTAQTPDIIVLDGRVFDLHTTPLEGYFKRIQWRPTVRWRHSGNRRGYVARWEVFEDRLFLTGLFGFEWEVPPHLVDKVGPDPDPFEPAQRGVKSLRLPDLFPDQAPLVFTDWVTERLAVPTGPVIRRVAGRFVSFHATYRTLEVAEGRVRSFRDWNAIEWARELRWTWIVDELEKSCSPAPTSSQEDGDPRAAQPNDEIGDWRRQSDPILRALGYELDQIEALKKPCGQRPLAKAPWRRPSREFRPGQKSVCS